MQTVARSAEDLGHILKQYRLSKNMNQSDLAKSVRTHQMGISRIENGDISRTLKLIFTILSRLDLEIEIRPRRKGSVQDIIDIFDE